MVNFLLKIKDSNHYKNIIFASKFKINELFWFFLFGFCLDLLSKSPFLENNFINRQVITLLEGFLSPKFVILSTIFFGVLYTFGSAISSDQERIKDSIKKTTDKIEIYSAPIIGVSSGFAILELIYKLTNVSFNSQLLNNTLILCFIYYSINFMMKLFLAKFDDYKNHPKGLKIITGFFLIGFVIFNIKSSETTYELKINLNETEFNKLKNYADKEKSSMETLSKDMILSKTQ